MSLEAFSLAGSTWNRLAETFSITQDASTLPRPHPPRTKTPALNVPSSRTEVPLEGLGPSTPTHALTARDGRAAHTFVRAAHVHTHGAAERRAEQGVVDVDTRWSSLDSDPGREGRESSGSRRTPEIKGAWGGLRAQGDSRNLGGVLKSLRICRSRRDLVEIWKVRKT